jgi:ribA/ribD-fused uncharacterized protein
MKITEKLVLFWNGPFSNWYPSKFMWDGMIFNCGEQYMMFRKAELFDDYSTAFQIMESDNPKIQKQLGRQVKNYSDEKWVNQCIPIMIDGLTQKFVQDEWLKDQLLSTGDKIIVEASPYDTRWGIGLSENDPLALDQSTWKGENFLGITLMSVRQIIRNKKNGS